jgi:hypothetical protein
MEKSPGRVIPDYFSLKGWDARKIQKELTDTLGPDIDSQAQISRWLVRFSQCDISSLDEARRGRPLSILGPQLEKLRFASARILAAHFNVSHSVVKDQ